jgi:hypothetical protein
MKFVVKDLMVSVLPVRGAGSLLAGCDAGCTGHCSGACTNPCASAGACASLSTKDLDWISHVFDPPYLAQIKQQLKDTIALVEAREKSVLDAMRPQSQQEVELLRAHLSEALEELKRPQQFETGAVSQIASTRKG